MSDNVTLNPASGGATVRAVQKGGASGPESQVVILDAGGGGAESLLAAGQQTMAGSLPVVIASNQSAVPVSQSGAWNVTVNAALPAGTNSIGTVLTTADTTIGSTTAPSKLLLVGGKTGDATPQYQPLPLTAGGAALKTDGSATTQPVSGAVTANQGGAPWSENVAQFGGSAVATGTGAGGAGVPRVTVSNDSQVKLWDGTTTAAVDAASTGLAVTHRPTTSGGPSTSRVKSAASTNATNVKASAGQVYGWYLFNNTSSAKFLKLFDKATAPVAGTDTPLFTVGIPANGGCVQEFLGGIPFGTGIGYAVTGGVADADTTATAADDVHGVLLYR